MEIDRKLLSPMMLKYMETKDQHPDCLLFYRLGDFYEMFFEDAKIVAKELELTLTGKSCGLPERAPMAGVPYHAADSYISRLVNRGYKVAVCDQMEDPKEAKGLVRREVTRIVTPGTNLDTDSLPLDRNNFLFGIAWSPERIGIAAVDILTGCFEVSEVASLRELKDELAKYHPSEIVANDAFLLSGFDTEGMKNRLEAAVSYKDSAFYRKEDCIGALLSHFQVGSLNGLGLADFPLGALAAGALFRYLSEMQSTGLKHIRTLRVCSAGAFMLLDSASRRNLELTETLRDKKKRGSLLWILDRTCTAMGARSLRSFVEQPLLSEERINGRLDAVQELLERPMDREEIREYLNAVYDLERLLGKVSFGTVNARDMIALKNSLAMLPPIKNLLGDFRSAELMRIREEIRDLEELTELIGRAITEEPPLLLKDGGIIRAGYDAEVDELRSAGQNGKQWLAALEEEDRQRTGIRTLKIKYNNVFGYFFEVTNSFKDMVPPDYERKQTLTNAERYTTPKLKELEDMILNAQDRLVNREYRLFSELREKTAGYTDAIQKSAAAIALLDVFASLAHIAEENHFTRPVLSETGRIKIRNGRHPVVEKMLPGGSFIPNDTLLDRKKHLVSIITGPNMAGKSTYMRQVALIVLMTQIGSFVPAEEAEISIADRIFTRVGASDDLASGQSTFMVEMNEVANILRNATPKSLLILDEIGRGTATYDGLAIAWAVIEHIANPRLLGARTLFATHYHELTELEGKLGNVDNYCIAVKERGDDIVFLRKIIKGGADKSYGIQVAKLAGVPDMVIDRAKQIVEQLSANDLTEKLEELTVENGAPRKKVPKPDQVDLMQLSFKAAVSDEDILKELKGLELSAMTPIDALNTLYRMQSRLLNRWEA